jgi:hypothetical protein
MTGEDKKTANPAEGILTDRFGNQQSPISLTFLLAVIKSKSTNNKSQGYL